MFMIRNVSKMLFGETSKQDLLQIDSGQLFLIRPKSPKGYCECIFKEAAAHIRRTTTAHNYQLVVQRVFEEGEEQLLEDSDDDDDENRDEKTFLLDESLHFRSLIRDGQAIFAWRDIQGDPEDTFEFICDTSTQPGQVNTFEIVAMQCQFERKYQKSYEAATDADLEQFSFSDMQVPSLSPPMPSSSQKKPSSSSQKASKKSTPSEHDERPTPSKPKLKKIQAATGEELAKERAELHLYDIDSGHFIQQDGEVNATVLDNGDWNYLLAIASAEKDWLVQPVITDISPVFNFDYLSFIFNAYDEDNAAYSWLLRFRDMKSLERFQEGVMRALWEHLNQIKWLKAKDNDRDYIVEAFQDITMTDASDEEIEADTDDADSQEDKEEDDDDNGSDQSENEFPNDDGNQEENSQLAVGFKTDRSFVIRGSQIGVFKHTPSNQLQFSTTINKVQTPKGKLFQPRKVMLHAGDRSLVLQNQANPNSVYKMDIETGKVVDEWKIHDDIPILNFVPENKFAQLTDEQTFIGHSRNALFRVDPRLSGNKMVDSELKQYVSKNDFSAAATTEKGYIAVASNKGDIRLFDRLGINAKSHLPALGDPITGIDVSADGRWILATCRTYLLLVDAEQHEGKYAGQLGFERSFGKDSKPKPRRLALSPSHVAQFQQETKTPLSFTAAKFNTGLDATETSIVTSTGPFIITWDMRKLLKGAKDPYTIRRYAEEVKADNFRFGSDKNVIVALPQQVDMVAKGSFKKPTRQSISTPVKNLRSRSSIVNSPY